MLHGVHNVVVLVAVQSPVPWGICHELYVTRSTWWDVDRGFRPLTSSRNPAPIGTSDLEAITVQMNWIEVSECMNLLLETF